LASNVDKLAQDVARAVRAEIDFYKSTRVVTDGNLLASCADNLRIALNSSIFRSFPRVLTGAVSGLASAAVRVRT
jgi:hypothetical protein